MLPPTVLNSLRSTDAIPPHVLMLSPTCTDAIPHMYLCYPPTVLNSLRSTEPTLYGVFVARFYTRRTLWRTTNQVLLREDSVIDFVWRNVPPRPLPPSSRNVKFQNDPLIVVSIAVSRANGPRPKHAPRIILANGDQGCT